MPASAWKNNGEEPAVSGRDRDPHCRAPAGNAERLRDLLVFCFNDTATTEIYTLSLHDALPIFNRAPPRAWRARRSSSACRVRPAPAATPDRKSTRLNSSHTHLVCRLLLENTSRVPRQREEPQDFEDVDAPTAVLGRTEKSLKQPDFFFFFLMDGAPPEFPPFPLPAPFRN